MKGPDATIGLTVGHAVVRFLVVPTDPDRALLPGASPWDLGDPMKGDRARGDRAGRRQRRAVGPATAVHVSRP